VEFFIENIGLFIIAIGSMLFLIWPWISKQMNGVSEAEPLEIVRVINKGKTLIVDIRSEDEFGQGRLSGSKNIPDKGLSERIKEIEKYKTKTVILVSSNNSRAVNAFTLLRKNGFESIIILRGGVNAWQQANLPMEKTR